MANEYAEQLDIQTQAVEALPGQYVDAATLTAVVSTLGARAQDVESTLWDLATQRTPTETATIGAQLDAWGALVGQPRLGGAWPAGESDSIYRQKLAAAVLRNRSRGTGSDLLGMLSALLGSSLTIAALTPSWPAGFQLLLIVSGGLTAAEQSMVRDFVDRTRGAGISASILYAATGPVFGFGTPSATIGGWGSLWATPIP
jgi:hypothetical protein